jgi:hypothetical protein
MMQVAGKSCVPQQPAVESKEAMLQMNYVPVLCRVTRMRADSNLISELLPIFVSRNAVK